MNRLEVRGVIVPSSYDQEWAADYINRGMITPESRFRNGLTAADKKVGMVVHINSPGGSVFAGNEMINALNDWTKETGQGIEINIGAMAASMAAAMVVNVNAVKVRAHKNTKIMFHGASTETEGGQGAHQDQADLLAKINNDMKATLVSRFKLSPEQVDGWFAEGRAGWLTAQDALKAGMISEIIDAEDKPMKMNKTAAAMIGERGLKLAAVLESEIIEEEVVADASGIKEPVPVVEAVATPAPVPVVEAGTAIGAPVVEAPVVQSADVVALHDAVNKTLADIGKKNDEIKSLHTDIEILKNSHAKEIGEIEKNARLWQARHDQQIEAAKAEKKNLLATFEAEKLGLTNKILDRDSRITELESRLSKLTLNALGLASAKSMTWSECLAACNGDLAKAKVQYSDVYETIMQAAKKKGKP